MTDSTSAPLPAVPEDQTTTVNIETLLRKMPDLPLSKVAQDIVDELLSKQAEPITPEFRKRMVEAAERPLRVRREIMMLAAFASGHRKGTHVSTCRECHEPWPCADVLRAAAPALDAALVEADATNERLREIANRQTTESESYWQLQEIREALGLPYVPSLPHTTADGGQ